MIVALRHYYNEINHNNNKLAVKTAHASNSLLDLSQFFDICSVNVTLILKADDLNWNNFNRKNYFLLNIICQCNRR